MSKRLLQRGRYPKSPGVEQITNTNTQYSQAAPVSQAPQPSINYYDPSMQPQIDPNSWNQQGFSNSANYQQIPTSNPSVNEQANYWSGSQMIPNTMQAPFNESWNTKPDSGTDSTGCTNYQQPSQPVQQWQQIPYVPIDNQGYNQHQGTTYNPLPQQEYQYQPSNSTTDYHSASKSTDYKTNDISHYQSINNTVNYQPANNNSNIMPLNTGLSNWENGTFSVTQPEELPWTYGTPQYCNPPESDFVQNTNPATSTSWDPSVNSGYNVNSDSNDQKTNPSLYLPPVTENSKSSSVAGKQLTPQQQLEQKEMESRESNYVVDAVESKEEVCDQDYASSTLSAFFHHSDLIKPDSECLEQSNESTTAVIQNSEISSQEIRTSPVSAVESGIAHTSGAVTEEGSSEGTHSDFVQEESLDDIETDERSCSHSVSPGLVEEPVNQEVPEPHINILSNMSLQLNKEFDESGEDPPNQQVPTKSGESSRSTSAERERLVIRPREDSPFKPPRPNNTKSIVVQQEVTEVNPPETKAQEEKTVVQEVNLETFPDNLERPSDYEELRKQSPLYASHKRHLRQDLNSSPSSLLCDNPDIPCVTLAPAAPPISSARSDKSESSTDSRSENLSHRSSNPSLFRLNEPVSKISSKENSKSEIYDKSKKTKQSSLISNPQPNIERPNEVTSQPKNYNLSQKTIEKDVHNVENYDQQPSLVLKDSKINGKVPSNDSLPESYQKHSSNAPYSEAANLSNNTKQEDSFYNDRRVDPRHGNSNSSRQKYADERYYNSDARQYYSDREGSRPSSRNSLREKREEYPYHSRLEDYPYQANRNDPRHHQEYPPRSSSRLSESDLSHGDKSAQYGGYYRQQNPYPASAYPKDPRDSGYYNRAPTHKGYEYDPYQRDMYYASYYDAYQRYAYNNFNYGFYDELYRNDPRYRQYREAQEQYRQYYAKHGYDEYERSSVHSGRSSANELAKECNPNQYREQDVDSNGSDISAYNLQQGYSYNESQNDMSNAEADLTSTPSSRLTPVKFSYAHPIARFSPGGILLTAIPSHLSTAMPIRIHNLQEIRENEESFQELKNHQGPLVRGLTHKNDVIEFCSQRIKAIKLKEDIVDRDSYVLLWELMVLLLRQNGSVAGSDIAELLLKDHEVLRPTSVPLKHAIDTPQGEHSPADVNDSSSQSHAGDASSPDEGIVVLHDKSALNYSRVVDVDKITRKFREFLLFGHKKDALEWAMKHGLWGHALFLASKMDLRTYANVMTRFANSLALNDPLQTLYQLMSGRQPLAVTNVADKKWGDWRPHLAMILSNPSSHTEVDSRSITTLGDTLASKGCLCAAHFCYIMAQVEFGTYEQKNSKLVLLTADHMLPFEEFASNEAIQCTEIYEYAQSLANPSFMLTNLQLYKFLYAMRLVEHGFMEEGLHYCEIIANKLQEHPHLFQYDFVSEVFKLATQLKYHDPHFLRGQGEYEDQDDPDWLKNLSNLVQNFNNIPSTTDNYSNSYNEQQQAETNQNFNVNTQQYPTPIAESQTSQNVTNSNVASDASGSYSHVNYYQPNNWNQQNSNMQNSSYSPNSVMENSGYYQNDMVNHQSSFHRENSIPSQEENETTDIPSSPVTQTPPFDYYSGGTQQEWSSAHSLPSISLSDVDHCHHCPKSDLESLVRNEETESDIALCSSSHSTPLHSYLLSKDDDKRKLLMAQSGLVDARTLNSCLKTNRSHNNKHKKCIKFDASVSGNQGRLQRTGIRRRRFSKRKNEVTLHSDSSPEGSPSKEKSKSHSKHSLLATLGLLKSDESSPKLSKKKSKAKKKNETIAKLLQSKKTFAIDEPFDTNETENVLQEKSVEESVQETKKIISILKKLSDDEKKNFELSKLMANEFNKKPPLIFGGTYPIDEPFETVRKRSYGKYSKQRVTDESFSDQLKPNIDSAFSNQISNPLQMTSTKPENHENVKKLSKEKFSKMSPLRMFKKVQGSRKKFIQSKEDAISTSRSTTSSSSNIIKSETSFVQENKSLYDTSSSFNSGSLGRERRDSALSSGSRYSTSSMTSKTTVKEGQKPETKKDKATTQAGKTWLGGIFSRLLPKAPNQMILPDDKNPTIVWDDVNNRWVNKDSNDDDESNAPMAPPTDTELLGSKSSENTFHASNYNSMPPPNSMATNSSVPPTSASQPVNKFQRPKTRGMRQNYVDVLSKSGSTKKTNVLPEGLFTPSYDNVSPKVFMPTSAPTPTSNDATSNLDTNHTAYNSPQLETEMQQTDTQSTPLMFNPAEFDSRRSSISNQRPTIGRMGRRTYPT